MHQHELGKPQGVETSSRQMSRIDARQVLSLFLTRAAMFWKGEGMVKATQHLAAAIVALSPLVHADLSYGAGRVFYDGFESGNTDSWASADGRNKCQVVPSAVDRLEGPHSGSLMAICNWNGSVTWDHPASTELMGIPTGDYYTNELFIRAWVRADQNVERFYVGGKILRIGDITVGMEVMSNIRTSSGLSGTANIPGGGGTYWGGMSGDLSGTPNNGWHKVEYYFNHANGKHREWHDGMLVLDLVGSFGANRWKNLYVMSNFAEDHDAINNVYFDDIEVFSDNGSGASGLMSDASISASTTASPSPPTEVLVR